MQSHITPIAERSTTILEQEETGNRNKEDKTVQLLE